MDAQARETGTVKWFDDKKGWGFINNPGGSDVFVHYRSIQMDGHKTLATGQHVSYLLTKNDRGPAAAEVTPLH